MIPIFITSALGYMPASIILTFTVQQGNTMNTRLGAINVPPATLFVIPTVFQLVVLVVYDRFIVPIPAQKDCKIRVNEMTLWGSRLHVNICRE
jgi:hypothetical protein